jgi:hypothetical protein
MTLVFYAVLLAAGLFVSMLLFLELGRRIGARRLREDPAGAKAGTGAIEGAVFALFGLLLAFTFSGAAARFDGRKQLVVEEANAIGTAYLRVDLMPLEVQPQLRDLFRAYLDSRIATYRKLPDLAAAQAELAHSVELQGQIWDRAIQATRTSGPSVVTGLVVGALNQMFDIVTTRVMAAKLHPPKILFGLLFVLGLGCSVVAGYGMAESRRRSWIHMVGFAAVTCLTVYVILDMEYPRFGLIRVDEVDEVLVQVRQSMR